MNLIELDYTDLNRIIGIFDADSAGIFEWRSTQGIPKDKNAKWITPGRYEREGDILVKYVKNNSQNRYAFTLPIIWNDFRDPDELNLFLDCTAEGKKDIY